MALLEALTVNLVASISKTLAKIWLKDEGLVKPAEGVIETFKKRFEDGQVTRATQKLFLDLEEKVEIRLQSFIESSEFRGLSENEKEAAVRGVGDLFAKLSLDSALMEADLSAPRLEQSILTSNRRPFSGLGRDTEALARLLLRECCNYIVNLASKMPDFEVALAKEQLKRSKTLLDDLERVLEDLSRIQTQATDAAEQKDISFEDQYRRTLIQHLDRIELFGVKITGSGTRLYNLSNAYVPLTAVVGSSGEPCPVETALAGGERAVIRGDAGLGKTTVMQWLAVQAARRGFADTLTEWNTRVPFYLRLRDYNDQGRDFPTVDGFLSASAGNIAGLLTNPAWPATVLDERGLLLIDGIDEVPADRRPKFMEWLNNLLVDFPRAIFVLSSRPAALDADEPVHIAGALSRAFFKSITLELMSLTDSEALITQWHLAVARDLVAEEDLKRLGENERALLNTIRHRSAVRNLASSPLLCAMICALNWDRQKNLPDNRMELYARALEMLLETREIERGLATGQGARLTPKEKESLLDGIALWMLRNGYSEAAQERADGDSVINAIDQILPRLTRVNDPAAVVLQELLERSGVLRAPQHGRVDFLHRTFLEYMGARAALNAGDLNYLVNQARLQNWRDVIVFAAGHAQGAARDQLITRLLTRPILRRKPIEIEIAAVCCLETIGGVLAPGLMEQLTTLAATLFPPTDFAQAHLLAPAAMHRPSLLEGFADEGPDVVAACIRAAAIDGGGEMLSVIAGYADVCGEAVDREIIRAWPVFDEGEFEEKVIKRRDRFAGVRLSELEPEQAETMKFLMLSSRPRTRLTDLTRHLDNFIKMKTLNIAQFQYVSRAEKEVADDTEDVLAAHVLMRRDEPARPQRRIRTGTQGISRLSRLTSLKTLRLPDIDLGVLQVVGGLSEIRVLSFRASAAIDLRPVAKLERLEEVSLSGSGISDIVPLLDCRNLRELSLTSAQISDLSGIRALGRNLVSLTFEYSSKQDFEIYSDKLQKLKLAGASIKESVWLGQVRSLKEFCLCYPEAVSSLPWQQMVSLRSIRLQGCPDVVLDNLEGVPQLDTLIIACRTGPESLIGHVPSTVSHLHIDQETNALDLHGLERLTNLWSLYISECSVQSTDTLLNSQNLKYLAFTKCSTDMSARVMGELTGRGVNVS